MHQFNLRSCPTLTGGSLQNQWFNPSFEVSNGYARRILFPLFFFSLLSGCTAEESTAQAKVTFDRNVESCICRVLAFEADGYSGLIYGDMVEQCNHTVRDANPTRYPSKYQTTIEINDLRCTDDVEDWVETLDEVRIQQAASRQRFQEFSNKNSDLD